MRSWLGVAAACVTAGAAWAGYWWLAVPRADICAAVLPAPAGCRAADRVPAATLWSAVVLVLLAVTVTVTFAAPRRGWWPSGVSLMLLVVAALVGYRQVLYTV